MVSRRPLALLFFTLILAGCTMGLQRTAYLVKPGTENPVHVVRCEGCSPPTRRTHEPHLREPEGGSPASAEPPKPPERIALTRTYGTEAPG